MFYELGILFNIEEIRAKDFETAAWEFFMRQCRPEKLAGSILYEGETSETLFREENVFCIAVQSLDPSVIDYTKSILSKQDDPIMLPLGQRFLEGEITLQYPLNIRAQIDETGQFYSWCEKAACRDQQLCADAGWPYGGMVQPSYDERARL